MSLTRLTPLDGEAIMSLEEAKQHLRVTNDIEATLIGSLRDAAISHVERVSGIALAPAEYRWTMRGLSARIELPVRPVTSVDAVAYHDAAGIEQSYAGARLVDGYALPVAGESWPAAYGYAAVTFTAGLASPDEAPDLLAAVKLLLGHLYLHREASAERALQEIPLGVDALIGTHRQVLV